ncbi:gliding motility-associated C-terminal domain-containing protein [Cnuella takakiae]|uniref:Gliding motility-associated C-terminal domain-containing protein n=1 Tax=Cnuella takakiae TaxID=1302690 RepID=A0A1M5C3C8_9BACT|nr:PKD domain-containing protein [Cnuella takakiae]OLY93600.1 hypothetical protein BUE76_18265 [Cnuella takakiae]SHF48942.1 gliding motility-associated C-terminal domain-containing protein [Cnuella takakiae]
MRKLLAFVLLLLLGLEGFASHIVGGEMIYRYKGPGAAPNTSQYTITLRLFRDELCPPPCAPMPNEVLIGIFDNDEGSQYLATEVRRTSVDRANTGQPPLCVVNPPTLLYNIAEYTQTFELPNNAKGYTAAYQTCCRVSPLTNVFSTGAPNSGTGSTYSCNIPGSDAIGTKFNNSPEFTKAVSPICEGKPFTMDFSVQDPDEGDSIVYTFCEAHDGGRALSSAPINPDPPPYKSVPYISGFSAGSPMGSAVTINESTGIITGVAPQLGRYVVCVCAYEYRNGQLISIHRKDFIVNVASCDFAGAQLDPEYNFCNSLTVAFQNLNSSTLNQSFFWDFGDGQTSTEAAPSHTYSDTGTYVLKLMVNKGQPCVDSTQAIVRVYPTMSADFSFAGGCVGKPTQFTDRSVTTHGSIAAWQWNFGDTTSTDPNPRITFRNMGARNVQLIVTNSKGCQETIVKAIDITNKPTMDLRFRDTLICRNDQVQLEAFGLGKFSWTPNINISGANTATPIVSPASTTTYTVLLDIDGCINTDSVKIRVTDGVTVSAMADTLICATDSIRLMATTNGLKYQWSPAPSLSASDILMPNAAPTENTTYRITASVGSCSAFDEVEVRVAPYPLVSAGRDTLICYGTEAQLNGSTNASRYSWTPVAPAQAGNLNPRVRPFSSQQYILTGSNAIGCTKGVRDTVSVVVLPPVEAFAGNDTAVVVGQNLQLQATGGITYQWQPATGLSNANIANPIVQFAAPTDSIRYTVLVANEAGCIDSASMMVRVFRADLRFFVPTAFTPNGDGLNDLFRITPAGIANVTALRVFNRWGQLVFQTSDVRKGWDGRINGELQKTGTYVWTVQGVDYTGKQFAEKGTITLIR